MADDRLDEAREAKGEHAPTVEVDPTNELLDGDDVPLPADLAAANVVIDESGTRLVHVDPAKEPGPDANLELRKLADKHYQVIDTAGTDGMVEALREEHRGLSAREARLDSGTDEHRRVTSRIKQVVEQLKLRNASVDPSKDEEADVDGSERASQAEEAAQERAAAAEATGKDATEDEAPKGRTARKRTTARQ